MLWGTLIFVVSALVPTFPSSSVRQRFENYTVKWYFSRQNTQRKGNVLIRHTLTLRPCQSNVFTVCQCAISRAQRSTWNTYVVHDVWLPKCVYHSLVSSVNNFVVSWRLTETLLFDYLHPWGRVTVPQTLKQQNVRGLLYHIMNIIYQQNEKKYSCWSSVSLFLWNGIIAS